MYSSSRGWVGGATPSSLYRTPCISLIFDCQNSRLVLLPGHSSCILKVISAHFWHISLSGWTRTQRRQPKQITQHLNGPCRRRFRFDSATEIPSEISVAINLTLCACPARQIVFTNHTNLWLVPFPLFAYLIIAGQGQSASITHTPH